MYFLNLRRNLLSMIVHARTHSRFVLFFAMFLHTQASFIALFRGCVYECLFHRMDCSKSIDIIACSYNSVKSLHNCYDANLVKNIHI